MSGSGSNHKSGRTMEECQRMINKSLQTPMVKFLREKMAKAGCNVGDDFFNAVNCEGARGFYGRGRGDCVKRRVMQSVMASPYCSETAAKDAVDAVWDICYNDTEPFDRAP